MADHPTTMKGYSDLLAAEFAAFGGIEGYGNLVDAILEVNPELIWPLSIRTFAKMRHEPQIAAILKVYFLGIQRAKWSVDGAGCRDEVTAFVADELGLPIQGTEEQPTGARRRNFTFAKHLPLALLDLVYGHMFFEQSYVESGGRWHLAAVQERMPHTVAEVKLNKDGTLQGIVQEAFATKQTPPVIGTANKALVYYVNEREGSNYFGRSILRPSYAAWLIKEQMLRVHATSIRRFGLGIPEYEAPANATPGQILEAQRTIGNFKSSEHAGIVSPNGFKARLAGLQGSVPDAVAFVNYLDRQMTRSTLTSLLDMATAERGARSLGETVMDLMVYAQQAVAEDHAGTGTDQIVVPLVDANWGEDEPAPRICVGDVGADVELTAQDVYWLASYWMNLPTAIRQFVMQRYGIDPSNPDGPAPLPGGAPTDG